jgi:hypothetical protein
MTDKSIKHRQAAPAWRKAVTVTAALLLAVTASLVTATAAFAAQPQIDPAYGPPPPPPPVFNPSCSLSVSTAAAGDPVTGTIDGAAPESEVTVTYDGEAMKSGSTDANGHASIEFTVPATASPGLHEVVFAGAGFSCATDITQVLGTSISRSPGGSGSLARTGIQVAFLLAVALVLLIVGLQLVRRARRQRRRLEAAERRRSLVS